MRRVCLLGAGKISTMHAAALADSAHAELVAVCDTDIARAHDLAEQFQLADVFGSAKEAAASGAFDDAHVLVGPDRHVAVAAELLDAGIGVLLEKPMGISQTECERLVTVAEQRGLRLGVNHNSVFYPAYLRLRKAVMSRSYGALQHVIAIVNHPVRWLRLVPGQWKLQHPKNLAYETVVHPFAQVYDLAGSAVHADATVSGPHELGSGRSFFDTWQVSLICERATAQVYLSHAPYQIHQVLAICEDGLLSAEVEENRFTAFDRSRWPQYSEPLRLAGRAALQELRSGLKHSVVAVDGALHERNRMDETYYRSMVSSIEAFHRGPSPALPNVDGRFGAQVVGMCDAATRGIEGGDTRTRPSIARRRAERCDVLVLGATDFIGATLIEQVIDEGGTARVMASDALRLLPRLQGPQLEIAAENQIATAVKGARAVVHLAYRWRPEVDPIDRSGAELMPRLTEACAEAGVGRLIHVGSVSSLDLADADATITGGPIDSEWAGDDRGSPGCGWARSEVVLARHAGAASVPLCILRPGIVLGRGGTPFHDGVGIWNSDTHCIGWNDGTNPLPLVLVSDVASAIRAVCERDAAVGRSYNLVGDVRLSAREYVAELQAALERPVAFHPGHPAQHQAVRLSKWLVKSLLRGSAAPIPSYRSLKSMGSLAAFDCSDAKADLGWNPVSDRGRFLDEGLGVYREPFWAA